MARVYYDADGDLSFVEDKVVAIIGYGNQGRSQALNMRDSGVKKVIVGSRKDSSWDVANEDGFNVYSIEEACKIADIVFILLPDEVAPEIYTKQIEPNLREGAAVNFASGYNITYNHIIPREDLDIIMVAPRMIGEGVRERFESGQGFPAFVVVHHDATGNGKDIALGLAKAIGSTKAGAIEVKFNDETYLDLMSEQAIWPLIMNVFTEAIKLLIDKGHAPEAVLTEIYLSKEPMVMLGKMADMGLFKQLPLHSRTSQYGQVSRFSKVNTDFIKQFLEEQYTNIVDGSFSEEWEEVKDDNFKRFDELLDGALNGEISQIEEKVKERLGGNKQLG